MNRHCHRLVYNRARGQIMAVAESAMQSPCASGQCARGIARANTLPRIRLPVLQIALWVAWGLLALPASAQIRADPAAPGHQRPTVLSAPNGVPLVNVQTPSAAGVSRNAYERFDVDSRGVVLNNSRTDTPTQLGGWVQGNPWLARGTARVILNEVRSSNPSLLRGFLEVAGAPSQIVVANPSGITCTGCGFINAPRATLTTGVPQLSPAGEVSSLRVDRGTVYVTGDGLDGRQASYTDIIARAVRLDGEIRAHHLSVIAGAQEVSGDGTGAVTPLVARQAGSAPGAAPVNVAIDVASLGGMYAGRITLVGHGAGVGVRNAGHIGATAGELVVTSDGRIENPGALAARGDIRIDTQAGLSHSGTAHAMGHLSVATRGDIDHSGVFAAGGNLQLSATGAGSALRATAGSLMVAGAQSDGRVGTTGMLTAEATATLQAQGQHWAGATVDMRAGGLDLSGSQTRAGTIALQATGAGINLAGADLAASQELSVMSSAGLRTEGALLAGPDIRLAAQSLTHRGGTLQAGRSLHIISDGLIDNSGGWMLSGGDLQVAGAQSASPRSLRVSNRDGVILATDMLRVKADSLGGDGQLLSLGGLDLDLVQDFLHTGTLRATRDMTVQTQGAVVNAGEIGAGGILRLEAASLDNHAPGSLVGDHLRIVLSSAQGLTNRGLIDGGQVDVDTRLLRNLGTGRLYGDRVALAADVLVNASEGAVSSVIAARERLDLGVGILDNREHALIFSAGDLTIGGALDTGRRPVSRAVAVRNSSATVEALGSLRIAAGEVVNEDLHFRTETVDLPGQQVIELAGQGSSYRYRPGDPGVYVYNDESDHLHTPEGNHEVWHRYEFTRQVSETRIASADPARILSGASLQITADHVLNDKGHILAGEQLVIRGGLTNTEPAGTRVTREQGEVITTSRDNEKGRDRSRIDRSVYQPPDRIESITLSPSLSRSHTAAASGLAAPPTRDLARAVSAAPPAGAVDPGVRIGRIDPRVPPSSLFRTVPDPASRVLVETDPRFTQYRTWLGSDYLLSAMAQDPAQLQKRLGDGFYEQRLVREQVAQLTGRRFLAGYASDEEQFRALMDNGATFARAHALRPGVALSAEQMAELTSDIVWLVEQDVTLPDGRIARALVPQVYARVREGDLSASGALIAGRTVDLQLAGDLTNRGAIQGADALRVQARNLKNLGGRLSGGTVDLQALEDIDNLGGQVHAARRLVVFAGRDLRVASTMATTRSAQGERTDIDRLATLQVDAPDGSLRAGAGRDLHFTAADVRSEGDLTAKAGRDLQLDALELSSREAIERDSANYRRESRRAQAGSTLQAQGNVHLQADNDLQARVAHVTSVQGALVASAGRDTVVESGDSRLQIDDAHRVTSRGFLSKTTRSTRKGIDETTAQASVFSGVTTELLAGRDMTIAGSQVVSESVTHLTAGRDLIVEAATESRVVTDERTVSRSGLFGSGGLGLTLGSQRQSVQEQESVTSASGSTVGSVRGDVRIAAAGRYRQAGSEVLAPGGDVAIQAGRVEVVEAREVQRFESATQAHQSGLTISLSNPVANAIQTIRRVRRAEREAGDSRTSALAALTQVLAVYEAGSAVADDPALAGGVSLNFSVGASRSVSQTSQVTETAAGSRVLAGGDMRIRAMGLASEADIVVQGSRVEAGGAVDFHAGDEVQLLAARNTSRQHSEERNASASVGMSVGLGGPTPGVSVLANASRGRGQGEGETQTWTSTQVTGAQTVQIESAGNTVLRGAVVQAPEVVARIGGDFAVESLQDTARQSSHQRSEGVGVSSGSTGLRGEVRAGRSDSQMDYASVTEQSGIVAGEGGFDIAVGGITDLKGGKLAGAEGAASQALNRLTTAAITTSHLENKASATARSSGVALSSDVLTRGKYGAAKALVASTMLNAQDSQQSQGQTRATISPGEVRVTDESRQRGLTGNSGAQEVAMLSRDTRAAHSQVLRPDVDAMQRVVNAQRAIKQETFKAVTVFTDEAYRSRFEVKPKLLKVECSAGQNCVNEPSKLVYREVSAEEFVKAPAGAVFAVNGILNDERRGSELSYQNADQTALKRLTQSEKPEAVYLMHIAPARHTLSELLGVAYEKVTAEADYKLANFLGYTSGQALYADLLKSRGQTKTVSLGHSRGTLVQAAAFAILANSAGEGENRFLNPNLFIRGVGGATTVENYTRKGLEILGATERSDRITFSYFSNDPVSTSSIAGRNPGLWTLSDLFQVWKTTNSMHSCYGSGAAGCSQVEAPVPGGPQGTPDGNVKLVRFVGGQLVPRDDPARAKGDK